MAKILILGFPAHGHVYPTLPVAAELVARGHQVDYMTAEPFREIVAATGAAAVLYQDSSLSGRNPQDPAQFPSRAPAILFGSTLSVLDNELDSFAARHPDLVVFDSLAPWGPIVAERLGVAAVASISTFALHRKMAGLARKFERPTLARIRTKLGAIREARTQRRALVERHGTRGPSWFDIYCNRGHINLVYTSREFQPFADALDSSHRFVGPSLGQRDSSIKFPFERLQEDRRRVLLSLGTSFNEDAAFFRSAIQALQARDDVQLIVAHGKVDREALGELPAPHIAQPFVPQVELLEHVDAFVTRGGMNSVSEALWHGVPIVGVPHLAEQVVVVRRTEQLGAGRLLRRREADEGLGPAVTELLLNDHYRAAADSVGETLRRAGGAIQAADEIEARLET